MRTTLRILAPIFVLLAVAATPAVAGAPPTSTSALPPLSVSPTHVSPGQSFLVTGSDCVPPPGTEALFEVEARGPDVGFGGGGDGVPGGHWGIELTVPAHTAPGVLRITAQCDLVTGKVRYPPSRVIVEPAGAPRVALSAKQVIAGSALTVYLAGFFANEHVTIALRGVGLLAVVTTDRTGQAVAAAHLPGDAPAGLAVVAVTGRVSGRTATSRLQVIVLTGYCGRRFCEPIPPPPLADTGVTIMTQVLAGAGLLGLGLLFLAASRRRDPATARYFR